MTTGRMRGIRLESLSLRVIATLLSLSTQVDRPHSSTTSDRIHPHQIEGAAFAAGPSRWPGGTQSVRMAKAKKTKPRNHLIRWAHQSDQGHASKNLSALSGRQTKTQRSKWLSRTTATSGGQLVAVREDL